MNKHTRQIMIGILAVIVVIVGVIAVTRMGDKTQTSGIGMNEQEPIQNETGTKVELYYLETATSYLKMEEGLVPGETREEVMVNALKKLQEPPKAEVLEIAVPKDISVLAVSLDDDVAVVNVSEDYEDMKHGAELLCRGAIVWTLTSLEDVKFVEITVNGAPLMETADKEVGKMNRDDIVIDGVISPEPSNSVTVTLYFANEDSSGLSAEKRQVAAVPGQLEKAVVEQLIAGPAEKGHYATIPSETKIRSVTTSDGICYVDLSNEFITKHSGGSTGEMLTIYSIVNSLTELENVQKVQFLIEGEKREEFKGHVDFSQPFEAKEINT